MQCSHRIVSRLAIMAALFAAGQAATAGDVPMTQEVKNLVEFQCHAAKTSKQAEANYADMGRGYTDAHPVMECLKKKIADLKAAGK